MALICSEEELFLLLESSSACSVVVVVVVASLRRLLLGLKMKRVIFGKCFLILFRQVLFVKRHDVKAYASLQ